MANSAEIHFDLRSNPTLKACAFTFKTGFTERATQPLGIATRMTLCTKHSLAVPFAVAA